MRGGLGYIQETPTPRMVNQEHESSCVVACARQLLRDAGVEFAEGILAKMIGIDERFGSEIEPGAAVLSRLHPLLTYAGGSVDPDLIHILLGRDPWIARVKTASNRHHAVIVDEFRGGVLSLGDPWGLSGPGSGTGTEATILFPVFLERWRFGIHGAIFPNGLRTALGT